MGALLIVTLPIAADSNTSGGSFGAVWFVFLIVGLLWLVGTFLVRINALYAMEITDDSITLNGVSGVFVEKLRAEKEGFPGQLRPNGESQAMPRPPSGQERLHTKDAAGRKRAW